MKPGLLGQAAEELLCLPPISKMVGISVNPDILVTYTQVVIKALASLGFETLGSEVFEQR